jgi:putative PIN family toxin of toxin-antitoxin system
VILAVLDTNVIVSAMIAPHGNEALVILAITQDLVRPCFSSEMLEEYSGVLRRPKFAFSAGEVDGMVTLFRNKGQEVRLQKISRVSVDPDDDKFIACAVAVGAQFLVTGNKRHFPQDELGRTRVVGARELLKALHIGA